MSHLGAAYPYCENWARVYSTHSYYPAQKSALYIPARWTFDFGTIALPFWSYTLGNIPSNPVSAYLTPLSVAWQWPTDFSSGIPMTPFVAWAQPPGVFYAQAFCGLIIGVSPRYRTSGDSAAPNEFNNSLQGLGVFWDMLTMLPTDVSLPIIYPTPWGVA